MNSQKRITITILFGTIFLLFNSVFAQPQPKSHKIPNEDQINKMVEDLSVELSLNEDQKTNIHELYINHFADIKEKMEQNKEKQKLEREEMDNHRQTFINEVKSLLSEEQQDKYDDFIENHRPKKERRHREK